MVPCSQWQNAEVVSSSLEKISNWLEELKQVDSLDQSVLKEMHDEMIENLDAIESIQICASHQTRIADGKSSSRPRGRDERD